MSSEVGIKIQQDPISICAEDAKQIADALVTMTSMINGPKEDEARPIVLEQKEEPEYCMTIKEDEGKDGEDKWYSNILQYV